MPDEPAPSIAYPPADVPPVHLERFVTLRDFEGPARERIHPVAWAYIDRGAEGQCTLAHEQPAWDGFRLHPRVLVDVSDVRLDSTILGRPVSMPVGIAPAALHGLCHADAELATARAAASAGVPMVLSRLSSRSLEAVAAAAPAAHRWFQLYVQAAPDQARLALGARAVFTARPFLWALACAGQPGVQKALSILRGEVSRAMSMLGAPSVDGIRRHHVTARLDWPQA